MEKSRSNLNLSSKDLLHSFLGSSGSEKDKVVQEEDVELSLGLSLGGRFGVDKSGELKRSSSIASCLPVVRDDDNTRSTSAYAGLLRTSSLPVETEEEWRKKKELRILRRMEAKRRRSEKQRNSRGDEVNLRDREKPSKPLVRLNSQGSVESKGRSSSSQQVQETSGEPSPSSNPGSVSSRATGSQSESPFATRGQVEDMPCVFTKGDGPNGQRVDGILYKYGKGEQVRIMCVCHGSFHSPAEFVEHAGWTNVDNPLKHIVVNQNSSLLL